MALRRGDQVGRQPVGSDIIDVADHLERLGRRVPLCPERREQILHGLGLRGSGKRQQRDQRNGNLFHGHPPSSSCLRAMTRAFSLTMIWVEKMPATLR